MSDKPIKTETLTLRTTAEAPATPGRLGVPTRPKIERATFKSRAIQALKTFLWVAPLTVLLWMYAEREMLTRLDNVPKSLVATSTSPDRIVTLQGSGEVQLDLRGPNASVTSIRDLASIKLPIDEPPRAEPYVVPVAEQLNELFKSKMVTVTRAEPATVQVRVERRVKVDVPLALRPNQQGNIRILEPKTVSVEGPESLLSTQRDLVVYADMGDNGKEPGEREVKVPIGLYEKDTGLPPPNAPLVTVPQTVNLKFDVPKSEDVEKTLPSIPLRLDCPVVLLSGYDVKYPSGENVPGVKVKGPREAVAKLTGPSADFQPAAILRLELGDFTPNLLNQKQTRTLKPEDFIMPPGVKVVDPVDIEFMIVKKQ